MTKFKRISEYTDEELEASISGAIDECSRVGLDFYTILKGIDSYFEKRNRKLAKEFSNAIAQNQPKASLVVGAGGAAGVAGASGPLGGAGGSAKDVK